MSSQAALPVLQAIDRSFQDIIVEGFLAGLYASVFFVTVFGLSKRLSEGSSTIWLLAVTIAMFCFSLIHFACHWYFARLAYVWDNTGPEGVLMALHSQTFAGEMTGSVAFAVNILIADCLFIWRCWIIWDRDWRIVLLPILTTLVGTIFSGLNLANQASVFSPNFINTSTPFLALSVTTTLLVTLLITFRIYQVSSDLQRQGGGGFATYSNVIEIIVESALINSVALLALLILIQRMDNNYVYAQNVVAQVSGLAPTLIIARISLRLARSSESWSTRRDSQVDTSLVFSSAGGNNTLNASSFKEEDIEKQEGISHVSRHGKSIGSSSTPSL